MGKNTMKEVGKDSSGEEDNNNAIHGKGDVNSKKVAMDVEVGKMRGSKGKESNYRIHAKVVQNSKKVAMDMEARKKKSRGEENNNAEAGERSKKGGNKGLERKKQVEKQIEKVTSELKLLKKELKKGKEKKDHNREFHTRFCHICFATKINPTVLKTHLMTHRTDRAVICKTCGASLNPAKWSNIVGKNGHFQKSHGFNERETLLNTIWKLSPEKEDLEKEDVEEEKKELYQFETLDDDEQSDEEESESSSEEETDEELLKYEIKIGKSLTENLKVILDQTEDEGNHIPEKDFLALKSTLFNS